MNWIQVELSFSILDEIFQHYFCIQYHTHESGTFASQWFDKEMIKSVTYVERFLRFCFDTNDCMIKIEGWKLNIEIVEQ